MSEPNLSGDYFDPDQVIIREYEQRKDPILKLYQELESLTDDFEKRIDADEGGDEVSYQLFLDIVSLLKNKVKSTMFSSLLAMHDGPVYVDIFTTQTEGETVEFVSVSRETLFKNIIKVIKEVASMYQETKRKSDSLGKKVENFVSHEIYEKNDLVSQGQATYDRVTTKMMFVRDLVYLLEDKRFLNDGDDVKGILFHFAEILEEQLAHLK